MSQYRDAFDQIKQSALSGDLRGTKEEEKFGFHLLQGVKVVSEGVFHGHQTYVISFTETHVVVAVHGPLGEPGSEWWFKPEDLRPLDIPNT